MRSSKVIRSDRRLRAGVDLIDAVASRVTDRDRFLCRMLYEHRVLTVAQIAELAFGSLSAAQHRLLVLYQHRVLDRFRPLRPSGSWPYHYVLDRGGAALIAQEYGIDPKELHLRHDKLLGLQSSQRLGHRLATSGFFTALAATARRHGPETALEAWWSEPRCATAWGDHVLPDGYGRWRDAGRTVAFFLECDRGTETHDRLAAKLDAYRNLRADSGRDPAGSTEGTAVLLWFHSAPREATFHQHARADGLTVATAVAGLGHPAGPVWRRLGDPATHRLPLTVAAHIPNADTLVDTDNPGLSWRIAAHFKRATETAVNPTWPPRTTPATVLVTMT